MKRKIIEISPGEIGAAIEGPLALIGPSRMDWRFLYKCGHFAPDHLGPETYSRSGQEMCIMCVKAK